MTRFELIAALSSAGFMSGSWTLDDLSYDAISVAFVREAHAAWLDGLPSVLRATREAGGGKSVACVRWVPESGDCDNIARDFGAYLSRCMWADAVSAGRARGNIAAGKFNFEPAPGEGHAVNWFVDHAGTAHVFDAASEKLDHLPREQLGTIMAGEST